MVNGFNFAGQSNYYTTSTSRETAVVEERQEHNIQHINRSLPPGYFYMYYIIKLLWGSGFGVVGCSISFLIDFAEEIAFCSFHRNCHSLHQFLRGGRRLHAHFIPNCLPTSPIYTLFFRQMDMGIEFRDSSISVQNTNFHFRWSIEVVLAYHLYDRNLTS